MKAKVDDWIRTTVDVPGFVIKGIIPKGTEGVIIEAYDQPTEGYAVDVNVVDENASNGYTYDNVVLFPDQFVVIEASQRGKTTIVDPDGNVDPQGPLRNQF